MICSQSGTGHLPANPSGTDVGSTKHIRREPPMKRFVFSLLAICLFATAIAAQSNRGNLTGTISDSSGVIQGATVIVKDNQSGKEVTVVTNDSGGYIVAQLDVGTYTVKVSAAGHKTFTATALKMDVGRDYTLNATLEAGNIAESVTVVAGADI